MKKYLVFFIVLFSSINVFALGELNTSSYSQANGFNSSSRYDYSTDNYLGDQTNFSVGVLGNRYNGKSYYFQFNFHYNIVALKTYDVTFTSDTYDFTNQINSNRVVPLCYSSFASNFNTKECENIGIVSVKRGSTSGGNSKEFTIRFTTTSNYTYWGFKIAGGLYNLTSVNNFKINNISFKEVDTSNSSDIINNANQNTQEIINNSTSNTNNIIDNQSNNTSSIINNNNENTQQIIDNEKELLGNCYTNILNPSNSIINSDNFIGYYVNLEEGSTYTLKSYQGNFAFKIGSSIYGYTDVENWESSANKYTFIYHKNPNNSGNSYTFLFVYSNGSYSPIDLSYANYVLVKGNYNGDFIPYNSEKCFSKLDETTNAINDTNSYLKDDSDPNISNSEFITLFDSVSINNPLSSLLQLPVQFINAIVSQSNSCQVVNLGTLWGVNISLPCINIGSLVGQNVWDTIDVLSSIGLIVLILKQLYESITNALTLGGYMDAKKGGLGYMPPLEFLCDMLTGFGGDNI